MLKEKNNLWLVNFMTLCMVLVTLPKALCIIGCVAKDGIRAEAKIASVEDNLNSLEKLLENKVDAETIEDFKQEINQSVLELRNTVNNSGVIKYGGAGWVVLGMGVITLIFLIVITGLIKYFLKSRSSNNLLSLVTKAVSKADPDTQRKIKDLIEYETGNGGPFNVKHKQLLSDFVSKNGTFANEK
jgi:hypothetical protein